ncbi:protein PNS1-like [Apium graveolens]|uniref:protein PNS1-like n=1 Tax=Apium graveolens TaxID=4045 RepID=UPI003D79A61C
MQVRQSNLNQFEMRPPGNFLRKLFQNLFFLQFLLIIVLVIFLMIRGLLSAHAHHFHPQKWYPPLLASVACGGIVSLLWQLMSSYNPSRTMRSAFWLSPLLTCAAGILFVAIGSPGSLAAGALAIVSAIIQSIYSCWVIPRFEYSGRVLTTAVAFTPAKTSLLRFLAVVASTLYSCFLVAGIGGATATGSALDKLFIFLILLSLTWTLHIIKNTIVVTLSWVKYMKFAVGMDLDAKDALYETLGNLTGTICIGSAILPILSVVRGSARAISLISGETDEFMFSCANCYSGVASRLIAHGNRWGFVQVGVYGKNFGQASRDTWELLGRGGLEPVIESDLTSSFCFLCGMAGGSASSLVGGSWTLLVHKSYATEVSIYAFLIGYFMTRVSMAWQQACILAYYVAYAENPQNQRLDPTISERIKEIQRLQQIQEIQRSRA